jgi:hypothetical protein
VQAQQLVGPAARVRVDVEDRHVHVVVLDGVRGGDDQPVDRAEPVAGRELRVVHARRQAARQAWTQAVARSTRSRAAPSTTSTALSTPAVDARTAVHSPGSQVKPCDSARWRGSPVASAST